MWATAVMLVVVEFPAADGADLVEAEEGDFVEFVAGFVFFYAFFYWFELGLAGEVVIVAGASARAGRIP